MSNNVGAPPAPVSLETAHHSRIARLIVRGSAIVVAATLFQKVLGFVLALAMIRHYSPTQYGEWGTATAVLGFFTIITDGGIDTIVVREASRKRADLERFIGSAIIAKIALSVTAYAACLLFAFLSPYSFDLKVLILVAAISMLFSFNSVYADVLQSELKILQAKTVTLVVATLTLIGSFAVILLDGPLFALAIVNVSMSLPALAIYYLFARRLIRARFVFDLRVMAALVREALPLAFSGVFIVIYYRVDTVLLSFFKPETSVAYYAATYKISEALNILPGAVMIAVAPMLARYANSEVLRHRLVSLYHTVFRYLLALVMPIVVGGAILSDQIMTFVDPRYLPAGLTLRLIIWAEIPMFLSPIMYQVAVVYGRQKLLTISTMIMAISNVGLNLVLIPLFDYNGAAFATSVTEFVGFVLGLWFVRTRFQIGFALSNLRVGLCLIPFALLLILPVAANNILLAFPAGVVYLLSIHFTGVARLHEIRGLLTTPPVDA